MVTGSTSRTRLILSVRLLVVIAGVGLMIVPTPAMTTKIGRAHV